MKIPEKINILSTIYTVTIHNGSDSPMEHKELDGEIDFIEKRIHLRKDSIDNMYKVLLHEIVHGIISNMDLLSGEFDEERFCQNMSSVLGDTLIRNGMIK